MNRGISKYNVDMLGQVFSYRSPVESFPILFSTECRYRTL